MYIPKNIVAPFCSVSNTRVCDNRNLSHRSAGLRLLLLFRAAAPLCCCLLGSESFSTTPLPPHHPLPPMRLLPSECDIRALALVCCVCRSVTTVAPRGRPDRTGRPSASVSPPSPRPAGRTSSVAVVSSRCRGFDPLPWFLPVALVSTRCHGFDPLPWFRPVAVFSR